MVKNKQIVIKIYSYFERLLEPINLQELKK